MKPSTKDKSRPAQAAERREQDPDLVYARNFSYLRDMQFLSGPSGDREFVVLTFESFKRLMRDYWAIATAWKTKDDESIPWEDALAELRADGILPAES